MWPTLNVTIFSTHVRNLRNGGYANVRLCPSHAPDSGFLATTAILFVIIALYNDVKYM